MTENDKKRSYTTWIIIGVIAFILILGIILYLLYKKISTLEYKVLTLTKLTEDNKLDIAQIKSDIHKKEEKLQEFAGKFNTFENLNTEIKYNIKELKKNFKKSSSDELNNRVGKQKVLHCDDNGCVMIPANQVSNTKQNVTVANSSIEDI